MRIRLIIMMDRDTLELNLLMRLSNFSLTSMKTPMSLWFEVLVIGYSSCTLRDNLFRFIHVWTWANSELIKELWPIQGFISNEMIASSANLLDFNFVTDLSKSIKYKIIKSRPAWNLEVHLSLHPMKRNVVG